MAYALQGGGDGMQGALVEYSGPPPPSPPDGSPPSSKAAGDEFSIESWIGQRVILHLFNGSLVCGLLWQLTPDGTFRLTEAIQGTYMGSKSHLGQVDVPGNVVSIICLYHCCSTRCVFPLNKNTPIDVVP